MSLHVRENNSGPAAAIVKNVVRRAKERIFVVVCVRLLAKR
jgi:hypothetical protein